MSEPLWDDGKIRKSAIGIAQQATAIDRAFQGANEMVKMRDDYERRIAELEAQLAERGEWENKNDTPDKC